LEIVKSQGYAVDDEEYNIGVRCVAVPIYDYHNSCVAAFGISGPASRLPLDKINEIANIVLETGQALSAKMKFNE
jgi:DNA-binding IclR family transcriptional regulator